MLLRSVSTSILPLGTTLGCALYDGHNTKLLGAGVVITRQLLESLQRRHIGAVKVSQEDAVRLLAFGPQGKAKTVPADRAVIVSPLVTSHSRQFDDKLGELLTVDAIRSGPQFSEEVRKPVEAFLDNDLKRHLVDQHEQQVQKLDALHSVVLRGGSEEVAIVADTAVQSLTSIREDQDAYVCLGANPAGENYPGRHSLHAAMVAISVGTTMGLDEAQLRSLAVGCLVHDLGMAEVDPRTLALKKRLEPEEFCDITRHPIRTFDLIEEHLDLIPAAARMVAYQLHERYDGTGYPRRRAGTQIHKLARIAAVADAYAAIVAPRPHRAGMLPYYAITKIVKDAAAGKYDPEVVRGLLKTVSLFPLGSLVELSNRMVGRVIRTSGEHYDRPIVEAWPRGKVSGQGTLFNLAEEGELRVFRMLESLD